MEKEFEKTFKHCEIETCTTQASFGFLEDERPSRCKKHSILGMLNLKSKKCLEKGCSTVPSYNARGSKTPRYCASHKKPGMINVKSGAYCREPGCETVPSFGVPSKEVRRPIYCKDHKKEGMINVRAKLCEDKNCFERAMYGYETRQGINRCYKHKTETMIPKVGSKNCLRKNCKTKATHGFPDEGPIRCGTHAEEGMLLIVRNCKFEGGCHTSPYFNFPGNKSGIYCDEHKKDGMINVRSKNCAEENCPTTPYFNYPGEKTGLYCNRHKKDGMMNVLSKLCEREGCKFRATFSHYFGPLKFCSRHKEPRMVNDNRFPKCDVCKKAPAYYSTDIYPYRCESCKVPQDKNIVERPCFSCDLKYILVNDTNLCFHCHDHSENKQANIIALKELFVDNVNDKDLSVRKVLMIEDLKIVKIKKEKKYEKKKELAIKSLLEEKNIKILSHNKTIVGQCTRKYRPDFIIQGIYFDIILECDEYQHGSYRVESECEKIRMHNIYNDYGSNCLLFIRYNPDPYKDHKGQRQNPIENRRNYLIQFLKNITKHILKEGLYVVKLFFDDFDEDRPEFMTLDDKLELQSVDFKNILLEEE